MLLVSEIAFIAQLMFMRRNKPAPFEGDGSSTVHHFQSFTVILRLHGAKTKPE